MPRPDVSDERIPQILDAAARVFSQHGIDGASMTQVADASGVSKATIYHYFASKDALILALVQRLFDADQPELEKLVTDDTPAVDRLYAYSVDLVALLEQNRVLAPIIAEIRARADRMEAIQSVISTYLAGYIRAFTRIIQQGIDGGELRQSLDASGAALACAALIEGAILIAQHSGQPLEHVMATSMSIFLAGLKR
ncbi:MAG: TetR/AcrR family transcriptional regulator [Chloroflexota bacterium]